ncbi:MAG: hypothetical protein IKM97_01595 [Clostridia bacterium]|nr:hypothetical protein [Clostridia bacterium]
MEKNNNKYLIFSICLFSVSLILNYNTFYLNNIYLYNHFDFTGISKIIQIIMTIIILIISSICLIKSIQAKENGVDFLFNKFMSFVFIIYAILCICTYIYIRSSEEEVALKMKNDLENYGENFKQEQLNKNKYNNKNSFEYDYYNFISEALSQNEYAINDEYYDRKKEILEQVENSSKIERYLSMLIYNFSYQHYGSSSIKFNEIQYYGIFLILASIGLIGAKFYSFNMYLNNDTNIFYNKNKI